MIITIDTKDRKVVKVGLKDQNGQLIVEKALENEYGSQILLPLVVEVLKLQGLTLQDLTEVEAGEGPGSFTGLRVGASVAQAFGFSLKIPVNNQMNRPIELKYS